MGLQLELSLLYVTLSLQIGYKESVSSSQVWASTATWYSREMSEAQRAGRHESATLLYHELRSEIMISRGQIHSCPAQLLLAR